jgi:D-sedoheptulose 7-phosphate isomerase
MEYAERYFNEVKEIASTVNLETIEKMIQLLIDVREKKGRIFFLGVGGSAANCTHAVNDFRKLAHIESYAPVDNVAELTARTNDEGWHTVFEGFLKTSHLNENDILFILSVGGGNKEKNISANLVFAMEYAKKVGARITGITGRDGGFAATVADELLIIPTLSPDTITPHAEAWQAVVWHMIVSDPRMLAQSNKWESIDKEE